MDESTAHVINYILFYPNCINGQYFMLAVNILGRAPRTAARLVSPEATESGVGSIPPWNNKDQTFFYTFAISKMEMIKIYTGRRF